MVVGSDSLIEVLIMYNYVPTSPWALLTIGNVGATKAGHMSGVSQCLAKHVCQGAKSGQTSVIRMYRRATKQCGEIGHREPKQ